MSEAKNSMQPPVRCRHRDAWCIEHNLWCPECGAWRPMRTDADLMLVPRGGWHRCKRDKGSKPMLNIYPSNKGATGADEGGVQ